MIVVRDLRAAIVAALEAAAIPGVVKIKASRQLNTWPEEGTVLLVYTQETTPDGEEDTAPRIFKCTTTAVVQLSVLGLDDEEEGALEDRMDEMAEAVVRALQPVHTAAGPFNGVVQHFTWRGNRPTITGEGEVVRGSTQMLFSAVWEKALPDEEPVDEYLRSKMGVATPAGTHAEDLDSAPIVNMRTP